MVSSSKILTVSYGTFSCTAEGFDDPLQAVKETTQFFRGVVNEDRFFGAEPPQVDSDLATEMMRERLSPDLGDGRVTLGTGLATGALGAGAAAVSTGAIAAALSAEQAAALDEDEPADLLPDDDTIEATAVLSERVSDPEFSDAALLDADLDTAPEVAAPPVDTSALTPSPDIAAKLDRIRAVVAEEPAKTPDPAPQSDNAHAQTADADLDDPIDAPQEPHTQSASEDVSEDVTEATHDVDSKDLMGEQVEKTAEELKDIDEDFDAQALENALSEVETATTAQADTADTKADLCADKGAEDQGGDKDILTNLADAFTEPTTEKNVQTPDPAAPTSVEDLATDDLEQLDDDALDALLNELQAPEAEAEADTQPKAEPAEELPAQNSLPDADLADTIAGLMADEASPTATEPAAEPAPEQAPATPIRPVRAPTRARVVKVKRAQFQKAIEAGEVEEIEELPEPAPAVSGSSLSAEDEADLAAELAAVKAELDGTATQSTDAADAIADAPAAASEPLRLDNPIPPAATASTLDPDMDSAVEDLVRDSARKAVKMASPARAMLTETSVEDGDTSRLLDQTNSEMDEPEGNRRRTAIAHLRAAVAATKAERLLGKKDNADDQMEPYREDLATVVRPRRPQAGTARTERPKEPERPAPLKLVAEQRVEDMPAAPVRPRRVQRRPVEAPAPAAQAVIETPPAAAASAPEPMAEAPAPQPKAEAPQGGFAAYAQDMGARELPELLEAAAAYMSFVEGRPQFSRPQLMTIVREAELEESSREDRLRNFGQLLREGKIEKTAGGRFTASQRISFRP
ncbi:MAG: hypothetical protein N4A61_12025 [Pelagimonas sp.]|jgi:hypothetical protein|nr:hypothetical protein [Pelagimonas sp.]